MMVNQTAKKKPNKILVFATQGSEGNDEARIKILLSNFDFFNFPFLSNNKLKSFTKLINYILQQKPDLVVMEGTGAGGGIACILGRIILGIPYVISSGDAVAPFIASKYWFLLFPAYLYERTLCKLCTGFIGWSPYLVGRALTFGSPRGVTAPGWSANISIDQLNQSRTKIRDLLGIKDNDIVFGILGSLIWNNRLKYCYGMELVRAFNKSQFKKIKILIVGGGNGQEYLQKLADSEFSNNIFIIGPVPREEIFDYLSAMDVASLPQSLDGVGNFRYTTKISEYISARLPVVTGDIPMAYDICQGWVWHLPGETPWGDRYVNHLAILMDTITTEVIDVKKQLIPREIELFSQQKQVDKVTDFINDILADLSVGE